MNFNIPLKRQPKQEKYDFPVLTMQAEPIEKGGARRFLLNKAAFELLGLNPDKKVNETLSIGFPQNNNGNFVIAVTTDNTNIPDKFKYAFHKSGNSFSDLTLYNAIKRELNLVLAVAEDIEFKLTKNENGIIIFNRITGSKEIENIISIENINTVSEQKYEEEAEEIAEIEQREEEHELKLN